MPLAFLHSSYLPLSISISVSQREPLPEKLILMDRNKKHPHGVRRGLMMKNNSASTRQPRKSKFYAVRCGRDGFSGVLRTWDECKAIVYGVKGAVFKSFKSHEEAYSFAFPSRSEHENTAHSMQSSENPEVDKQVGYMEENEIPLLVCRNESEKDTPARISVYTDGACSRNGGRYSKAGYGVFFHENSPYNVSEPLPGPPTNQRAELTAVLEAMQIVMQHGLLPNGGLLEVYTDSMYAKNGIETWTAKWKRNKWKTAQGGDVQNKDLWLALDITKEALVRMSIQISLNWVKGHHGNPGNEAADRLAVNGMLRCT